MKMDFNHDMGASTSISRARSSMCASRPMKTSAQVAVPAAAATAVKVAAKVVAVVATDFNMLFVETV